MAALISLLSQLYNLDDLRQWLGVLATPVTLLLIAVSVTQRLAYQERLTQNERRQQEAFKEYLKVMVALLIENNLSVQANESTSVQAAKAITLAVLREIDHERRLQLIEFLNDARLIQCRSGEVAPTLLKGANLCGINLQFANLREADLREANLKGTNLSGAKLVKANLCKANLQEADLRKADLDFSDLSQAFLWKAKLDKAFLPEANLENTRLDEASLCGAYLRQAKLSGAVLSAQATIEREIAKFEYFDAQEYGIKRLFLWRILLIGIDLRTRLSKGAKLRGADLIDADLSNTDLERAILQEASLSGANLSQANLCKANLIKADLRGAELKNAKLQNAITWFARF